MMLLCGQKTLIEKGGITLYYTHVGTTVIDVDLENNYVVRSIAKYSKEDDCYYSNFQIYRKDIEICTYIYDELFVQTRFNEDRKNINKAISDFIENNKESFESHIRNYEYMLLCFDTGNSYYESL